MLPRAGRAGRPWALRKEGLPVALGFLLGFLVCRALHRAGKQPAIGAGRGRLGSGTAEFATSNEERQRLVAFVGVQTGFTTDPNPKYNYEARRAALRSTCFPGSREEHNRLEAAGVVARFVIGHSADADAEAALADEEARHADLLRLPLTEGYAGLPAKTIMFLRAVTQRYDPKYIVKVDDDVYIRLDRLPHAVQQWGDIHADYVGCMKTGPIVKSPKWRWYEPQHVLLGGASYFTHAWGSLYVLSGRVAADLAAMRDGSLRHFANEDVTIGSWLLAFNTTHYDDRRLCETQCSETSLGVYDFPQCAGLCDAAAQLPELHASPACQLPATTPTGGLPLLKPLLVFDGRPDLTWHAAARRQLLQEQREAAAGSAQPALPAGT